MKRNRFMTLMPIIFFLANNSFAADKIWYQQIENCEGKTEQQLISDFKKWTGATHCQKTIISKKPAVLPEWGAPGDITQLNIQCDGFGDTVSDNKQFCKDISKKIRSGPVPISGKTTVQKWYPVFDPNCSEMPIAWVQNVMTKRLMMTIKGPIENCQLRVTKYPGGENLELFCEGELTGLYRSTKEECYLAQDVIKQLNKKK